MEKAESYASGLDANLRAQRMRSDLLAQTIGSAGNVIGGGIGGGGLFSNILSGIGGEEGNIPFIPDWLEKILGI
jgi:hypothetical protein